MEDFFLEYIKNYSIEKNTWFKLIDLGCGRDCLKYFIPEIFEKYKSKNNSLGYIPNLTFVDKKFGENKNCRHNPFVKKELQAAIKICISNLFHTECESVSNYNQCLKNNISKIKLVEKNIIDFEFTQKYHIIVLRFILHFLNFKQQKEFLEKLHKNGLEATSRILIKVNHCYHKYPSTKWNVNENNFNEIYHIDILYKIEKTHCWFDSDDGSLEFILKPIFQPPPTIAPGT